MTRSGYGDPSVSGPKLGEVAERDIAGQKFAENPVTVTLRGCTFPQEMRRVVHNPWDSQGT